MEKRRTLCLQSNCFASNYDKNSEILTLSAAKILQSAVYFYAVRALQYLSGKVTAMSDLYRHHKELGDEALSRALAAARAQQSARVLVASQR